MKVDSGVKMSTSRLSVGGSVDKGLVQCVFEMGWTSMSREIAQIMASAPPSSGSSLLGCEQGCLNRCLSRHGPFLVAT